MIRGEAAAYLRVSTRQLDRLRLPRTVIGARPRYSKEMLEDYLQQRVTSPAEYKKPGPIKYVPIGRPRSAMSREEWHNLPTPERDRIVQEALDRMWVLPKRRP